MIIAGLRLSQGGGIALIRDGRLEFAAGIADLNSDPWHSRWEGLESIPKLLAAEGYDVDEIDAWAVDGGHETAGPSSGAVFPAVTGEFDGGLTASYTAYPEAGSLAAGAYCTSPFACRSEPSVVLVWDGDRAPLLFHVGADGRIEAGGEVMAADGDPLEQAARAVRDWRGEEPVNLCFGGDHALDIQANSFLRDHPVVRELWVPPFPDASGAAIGAAALHLGRETGLRALDWGVRSGPEVGRNPHLPEGWSVSPCRPEELGRLLHLTGKPVIFLNGRRKTGPTSLGSRSVLQPAVDAEARALLGKLARGNDARDVPAALCLTGHVAEVFEPGTPDPYRSYEHRVRPEWAERLPAIAADHGVAVQTVEADDDQVLTAMLSEYQKWSGVPVLCCVDAGRPDSGLYPDAVSAMGQNEIDTIWASGVLYRRNRCREA